MYEALVKKLQHCSIENCRDRHCGQNRIRHVIEKGSDKSALDFPSYKNKWEHSYKIGYTGANKKI